MNTMNIIEANIQKTKQTDYAIEQWKKRLFAEEVAIVLYSLSILHNGKEAACKCLRFIKEKNLYKSILFDKYSYRNNERYWKTYCRKRLRVSSEHVDLLIKEIEETKLAA